MNIDKKFRAWNRIVRRMEYFTFQELGDLKELIQWQNLEFSESTSLLDKNGKEIYEGDILLIDGHRSVSVIWYELFAGFDTEYISDTIANSGFRGIENKDFDHRAEIVGNIYENHELLK